MVWYSRLFPILLLQITSCFAVPKIIELDHDLGHDTPYFIEPGAEPFSLEVVAASNRNGFWLAVAKYQSNTNMGTSVAAPYNLYEQGLTIDQIPLDHCFGEASVIDIRSKVAKNYNYELSAKDVEDWVAANGVFPNNSFVLLHTGWEKGRYPDQLAYFGDAKSIRNLTFPGISADGIHAILKYEKTYGINIRALGTDTPRFENGPTLLTRPISTLVASLNKYAIRNLRNLESLPPTGARIMVLPLKIRNSPTAPARVLARLPY